MWNQQVKRLQRENKLDQLVDSKLQKQYDHQEVEELIQVQDRLKNAIFAVPFCLDDSFLFSFGHWL
jgi:hypothetical protein